MQGTSFAVFFRYAQIKVFFPLLRVVSGSRECGPAMNGKADAGFGPHFQTGCFPALSGWR
jgi:hypothetical protein